MDGNVNVHQWRTDIAKPVSARVAYSLVPVHHWSDTQRNVRILCTRARTGYDCRAGEFPKSAQGCKTLVYYSHAHRSKYAGYWYTTALVRYEAGHERHEVFVRRQNAKDPDDDRRHLFLLHHQVVTEHQPWQHNNSDDVMT